MIYGERIRFRAPEREDLPMFTGWINDPEVRYGLLLFLPMSLANEEQWFDNMLKRPQEEQPMTIETKKGKEWIAIGNCGFFEIDKISRSGEVGIMIGEKEYWNQGFGTEAMKLLLKHGFETLNLNRVLLRVYSNNPRAIRCYEKAGYVHEGSMRQAVYQHGQYVDMLFMSVLREEWKNEE